ncbi:hypothetical protein Bbelb_021540 [Branchiostoma belcheri]|nr:hypothetical protein Bbelb_021540 [Branchiostoma belcheri]
MFSVRRQPRGLPVRPPTTTLLLPKSKSSPPRVTEHWNDPVRNPLLWYFDTCYPVVNGLRALASECRVEVSTGQRVPSQDSALEFLFPSAQGPEYLRYFPREFRTGRPYIDHH